MDDRVEPRREFIEKHAPEFEPSNFPSVVLVSDIKIVNSDTKFVTVRHKACQGDQSSRRDSVNSSSEG